MDLLQHLWLGLEHAVTLQNLLYCFIGVSVGTLIGVLPGTVSYTHLTLPTICSV